MIINVTKAKYIDNFVIKLTLAILDNGINRQIEKVIDLKEYIKSKKEKGIFAPLKDINYFKNFKLSTNTIEWENGADIAPERFLELKNIKV